MSTRSDDALDAFRSGKYARRERLPVTENPHPPGTLECNSWLQGYRTEERHPVVELAQAAE